MQLNDILEEHSIKQISKKTKISEENIERLLEKRFDKLDRVKAIGFLSIIEREFGIKLDTLKQEANNYYAEHIVHDQGVIVGVPLTSSKRGKSKWFLIIVFALLAYASWYFVTQFDKTHLNTLLPTTDDVTKMVENVVGDEAIDEKELVIGNTLQEEIEADTVEDTQLSDISTDMAKNPAISEAVHEDTESEDNVTNAVASQTAEVIELNVTADSAMEQSNREEPTITAAVANVAIVPVGKLWFGVTEKETQNKKQQIAAEKQEFDVNGKSYLIATSTAPFSVVYGDEKKEFRDLKIHYLLLDADGVRDLSKEEYTQLGGWGW